MELKQAQFLQQAVAVAQANLPYTANHDVRRAAISAVEEADLNLGSSVYEEAMAALGGRETVLQHIMAALVDAEATVRMPTRGDIEAHMAFEHEHGATPPLSQARKGRTMIRAAKKAPAMRIGKVIHKYRIVEEIEQRQLAQEIGISASTLCRLEKGQNCDANALSAILRWLLTTQET